MAAEVYDPGPARSASVPSCTSASAVARSGPGLAVLAQRLDTGADPPPRRLDALAGLRRGRPVRVAVPGEQGQPQVQRLGRAQQLDRQDLLDVPEHRPRVARRGRY